MAKSKIKRVQIEYVNPKSLIPFERNTKDHPPKQVDELIEIITKFGFKQPIVIDKNNIIRIGTGRWMASMKMGLEEVPVIVDNHLSDVELRAMSIADNKISEKGFVNYENVKLEFEFLKKEKFNIEVTAYDYSEINKILDQSPAPDISSFLKTGDSSNPFGSDSEKSNEETDEEYLRDNPGPDSNLNKENIPSMVNDSKKAFESVEEVSEVKDKRYIIIINCESEEHKQSLKEKLRPLVEEAQAKFF